MDGLQVVTALKSNPRTATIPVMMYTTKEGDVYVSQARALGALGVIPKTVQPGALFNMLLTLGLVTERRTEPEAEPFAQLLPDPADHSDPEADEVALGASVQALVTRTLEEQHVKLRSDIQNSQRDFARRVAHEVHQEQQLDQQIEVIDSEPPKQTPSQRPWLWAAAALIIIVPSSLSVWISSRITNGADQTQAQLTTLVDSINELTAITSVQNQHEITTDVQAQNAPMRLIPALEWALNQQNNFPHEVTPFDTKRALQLEQLMQHLASVGFKGTVRIESHLGDFCLVEDDYGQLHTPAPTLPVSECQRFGHRLDGFSSANDRQSVEFSNLLSSSPLFAQPDISVELIGFDRAASTAQFTYPNDARTADEWNSVASLNNRVVYHITERP